MCKAAGYLTCVVVMLGVCGVSWGQLKATNPDPPDGTLDAVIPLMQWTAGTTAMLHDVYFGTDPDLGPDDLVQSRSPLTMYYHVMGLTPGTTYYWRVDEIEKDGVTIHTGDVWTFTVQAMTAYYPTPADGSNVVALAPDLTWMPGQGAQKHHIYFSENQAAVADGAAEADRGMVNDPNYAPGELLPVSTYYWRVDEVGPGGTELAGQVWRFTTILPVDDFESYTDDIDAGEAIFQTWIDGVENGTGSYVGYEVAANGTFSETTVVHGGSQAMPMEYANAAAPYYSEAERAWTTPQNWSVNGADTLTLYVQGPAGDIAVPSVAVPPVLDGEAEDLWQAASVQYVTIPINGAVDGPEDCSGSFRVLYDADYLYAWVEVVDETLIQDSDPAQGWLDDRIEIFIDAKNDKTTTTNDDDFQYCFRWNFGEVEIPVEWYHSPESLAGVEYAVVTTESGYLFEIALPWLAIRGESPQAGYAFGIDVVINDDDDGGDRDTQLATYVEGTDNPHTPNLWGTALLADPTADGAEPLYVALADTSNRTGVVVHPDPEVVKAMSWVEWVIPLSEFADAGVNVAAVRTMYIGVGDRANPTPGGEGMIYVDDIYLTRPAPE